MAASLMFPKIPSKTWEKQITSFKTSEKNPNKHSQFLKQTESGGALKILKIKRLTNMFGLLSKIDHKIEAEDFKNHTATIFNDSSNQSIFPEFSTHTPNL